MSPPAFTRDAARVTVGALPSRAQVDGLLEAAGVRLTGPGRSGAVAFTHPGFLLCPIDPEETAAAAAAAADGGAGGDAGAAAQLQTAAVFMHESLVGSDSGSASGDDDDDGGGE